MKSETVEAPTRREEYLQARKVTLIGSVIDLLLGIGKIAAGWIGQSQALIADGVHSLSDLVTDVLVIFAARHASQDADEAHPYGHGRIQTMATVLLAGSLILVGIGIAWDAIRRISDPEQLLSPGMIAIVVASVSAIAKEAIYHYTVRAARRLHSNLLKANAWHSRSDALSSVVVVIGVGGVWLGFPWADAAAAVVVALLIGHVGWESGKEAVAELIDTALQPEEVATLRRQILDVEGVKDAHDLRTRRTGSRFLVDVHIHVDPRISVSEGHRVGDAVILNLKKNHPKLGDITVHIDPEDDVAGHPSSRLPMRRVMAASIRRELSALGEEHPGQNFEDPENIVLHYLEGRLEVEIWLPLTAYSSTGQARRAADLITARIGENPEISRVDVLYRNGPEHDA